MTKSCLVIAGEKSGEDHFLSLLPGIKETCPDIDFWGVGGDDMKAQGVTIKYHLREFSSWGYTEVLAKIPFYLNALKEIEQECLQRKTESALLIDFQDFNLKLAQRLQRRGVKVFYYVAPQAWAWKGWRAQKIARAVHSLFVILPFEKKWFLDRGVERVFSVNHPLWKTHQHHFPLIQEIKSKPLNTKRLKILLLPGSRRSEVEMLLPEFIEALRYLRKEYRFEVSMVRARHLQVELYGKIATYIDHEYTDDQLGEAFLESDLALAASGTVTLTCALYALPTIVAYKTSLLNEYLFYTFVQYKGPISLANLIYNKMVFPEFLAERASGYNLYLQLKKWLGDLTQLQQLRTELLKTQSLISGEMQTAGEYIGEKINSDT